MNKQRGIAQQRQDQRPLHLHEPGADTTWITLLPGYQSSALSGEQIVRLFELCVRVRDIT